MQASQIELVEYQDDADTPVEAIPAPAPAPSSIVESMPAPMPLDGQITYAPVYDGACDAAPVDCGCEDALFIGDRLHCSTGACGLAGCSTCGELCSDKAWRPCITLCVPQDGWLSFEYLSWWQDGMSLPPLITTSNDPNVAQADAGVLGVPSTQILFGGGDVLDDSFNGGRLRFGVWLDKQHTWGIGGEYYELDQETASFNATSATLPIIARPFFNTLTGVEDSGITAFPGRTTSGEISATARTEFVGGGFNLHYLTWCREGCGKFLFCQCPEKFCSRTESMIGYRYLQLDEGLMISESEVSNLTNAPGSLAITDNFTTRNQFNGFDFGMKYRRNRGFWIFDAMFRMGVGVTRQRVSITGQTVINDPNNVPTVVTQPGGFLAQTSNIGTYKQDQFAVVPEFRTNISYQMTDHWRWTLGYTAIYWSNVVRPGDHISRDINPNLFPPPVDPFVGAQRPAFAWNTTDYWVQGLNVGAEYRW